MEDEYLTDGVYASFDGYQIWLAANHHANKVIAIDPRCFDLLMRYAKKVWRIEDAPSDLRAGSDRSDIRGD